MSEKLHGDGEKKIDDLDKLREFPPRFLLTFSLDRLSRNLHLRLISQINLISDYP